MKAKLRLFVPLLVASCTMSAAASPTSIGVFFDAEATDCDATPTPFVPFLVYVSALLGTDAAASGMLGAEFRVDGLQGIVSSVTPSPFATISLGDPTDGVGCNIAFADCMQGEGPGRVVLLYTIECISTYPVPPRTVLVSRNGTPSHAGCWMAPCVRLCDAPVFTIQYVPGGEARINNGPCSVAVQPSTWSAIKSIWQVDTVLQPASPRQGHR